MIDESVPTGRTPSAGSTTAVPPVEIIDPDGDRLRLRPVVPSDGLPPGILAVAEHANPEGEDWRTATYLDGEDIARLGDWCAWMRDVNRITQWHDLTWRVPAPADDPPGDRVPGELSTLVDRPVCIDAMDPRARVAFMRILSANGTRVHLALDGETACGLPTTRLAVTRTVDGDRITCGRCFAALDDAGRELDGSPAAMTATLEHQPDDTRPQPLPEPWESILAGRRVTNLDEWRRR